MPRFPQDSKPRRDPLQVDNLQWQCHSRVLKAFQCHGHTRHKLILPDELSSTPRSWQTRRSLTHFEIVRLYRGLHGDTFVEDMSIGSDGYVRFPLGGYHLIGMALTGHHMLSFDICLILRGAPPPHRFCWMDERNRPQSALHSVFFLLGSLFLTTLAGGGGSITRGTSLKSGMGLVHSMIYPPVFGLKTHTGFLPWLPWLHFVRAFLVGARVLPSCTGTISTCYFLGFRSRLSVFGFTILEKSLGPYSHLYLQ